MKKITFVNPCFNEEDNIVNLIEKVKEVMSKHPEYEYDHIFIDNASTDKTPLILRKIAHENPKVKVIFNSRNFGHIRSPCYALKQSTADATILMATDLQDPPEVAHELLKKWEEGFPIVKAVKSNSKESALMYFIRTMFYRFINRLSDIDLTKNYTGFGLYDKKIIDIYSGIDDAYPYFRGLISEIGFDQTVVEFTQPTRFRGITKNNFYTLYDTAMLGITNHTKVPLRLVTMLGFLMSILSLLIGIGYFVAKLLFWNYFPAGYAPIIISLFVLLSMQMFFLGIIGEYIGSIFTQVKKRPMVIEKDRLNF